MKPIQKAYCRTFQTALQISIPFLPYRRPTMLPGVRDIPGVLPARGMTRALIVTDQTVTRTR